MHLKIWISLAACVVASLAAPVNLEEREKGIYTYYAPKKDDTNDKRDKGIYDYYIPGKEEKKEKREKGIYTYYAPPKEDKREAVPQDFEDEVTRDA